MSSKYFFIFLFLLINFLQSPAIADYDISAVPEELKKGAFAVVRKSNTIFIIASPTSVTRKIQYAITILNDKGKEYGNLYVGYDQFTRIKSIDVTVYSKEGLPIRKIKKSDFRDQSYYPDYTLYSDNRLKYIEIFENSYPYTVEFEYEIEYDGLVGYPLWQPVRFYNVSIEQSELNVILNSEMTFHYKENNLSSGVEISEMEGATRYHWEVQNIPAFDREPYSPSLIDFTPVVYLAPDQFYYDGVSGDMSNWVDFGYWMSDLIKNKDLLPETTVDFLKELVLGIEDNRQKARIIYEYMQSKTRYVSVQLGIGGLQPALASEVDKFGYGDCKALSNYTKALMSVVGIKSYYAVIGSGPDYEIKFDDFSSSNQANHAILCILPDEDTIWLECTSQKIPFGYIGYDNCNRNALLITDEGGRIAKTTKYPLENNSQIRTARIILSEDGQVEAEIKTVYSGLQYENVDGIINGSKKEQQDYLYKSLALNDFEITGFNYSEKKEIIPAAQETISLKINNYTSGAGNRLFIPLNILNKWKYFPDSTKTRKTNIIFQIPQYDIDSVKFYIPQNFKVDFIPEGQSIESEFGEYSSSISYSNKIITYTRTLTIKEGTYPPEKYADFVSFFTAIGKNDNCKAILISEK